MMRNVALVTAAAALTVAALAPVSSQATATTELNIGSLAPDPSPWREVLEKVESYVEEKTGGQVNVILRPPGVMGEVEMVRETRKGERLQGAGVTTAALAEGGNIPVLQILELPYLFESFAQADRVLDTVLWEPASTAMKRRGFILGIWSENGFRSFGTKGKPVRSPDDLSGLKMRAQESDVHMAMYNAFGANAVQKPMTEVLTSLKSNVIDGLDNSPVYMLSAGLAEPLDYYTMSRHIYQPAAIVFSRRWFEELPADVQGVLLETKKYAPEGRKAIRDEVKSTLELFPTLGMEVVELTDAERDAFKAKGSAMHDSFAGGIEGGPEMLKTIRSAL
jgi:TRAP-type C4-dicarboxylate transport system substrate-binding protein